jgi:predicted transcriptional regulator
MSQSLVEHAKELTLALIATGNVAPKDMQEMLQKTYASLSALKAQEEKAALPPLPASETALVDWRKSITKHAVTCLECGESFKQLSLRHLRAHGLDNRSYRTKYGIPPTQPLSSRATTERRRQVVQEVRPWEKKQQLLQARERNGHPLSEQDGEAVHEGAEESGTAAPAQPKRQRKTSPRKTARQTRSEG